MTKSRCTKLLLAFSLQIYLLGSASVQLTQAATGFTITPPLQQIELPTDQITYQSTIIITNNQDQPATFNLSTVDFGDLEQGGGLVFLGNTPDSIWDKHRLTPWLNISPQAVTLAAKTQQAITVTITNDQNLSPGGHYAAIIASLDTTLNNISVKPSLSSLLFVNKVGGAVYDVEAKDLSPQSAWWGSVNGVQLKLTNKGNTHVTPRGQLQLKDPTGAVIAQGLINQQSGLLMPQQEENYQAKLTSTSLPWWPGNYTLVLSYRYDGSDQYVTQQTTIFSVGIATLVVLSFLGCGTLAWLIKRYSNRQDAGM